MQTFKLKSKSALKSTKIVQISDSHLIVVDGTDAENYKKQKARKLFFENEALQRTGEVHYAEERLEKAIDYAKSADLTLFTGDMIEFPTAVNIDRMLKHFSELDNYLYTFGNHDYMDYTLKESATEQYEKNIALFKSKIDVDLEFCKKEVNGINVALLDNSRFQFNERQLEELKKLFKEGKDVILGVHIPLYHPSLDIVGQRKVHVICDTCGLDYDLTNARCATEVTKEVISLIKQNHDKVLAIVAGHNHFSAAIPYYENIVEYVCAPTYLDDFYEFIIEPSDK